MAAVPRCTTATVIHRVMADPPTPLVFLSISQVENRLGYAPGGLYGAKLPPPPPIIGPVNRDGTLPRGTHRGCLPESRLLPNLTRGLSARVTGRASNAPPYAAGV